LDAVAGDFLSDAPSAFARYEAIRPRLPEARYPPRSQHLSSLEEVADHVDGFLLDAFGVLNVGETAIPGAVARLQSLRRRGKRLAVLTNAASYTRGQLLAKYHRLGFDFTAEEVVASRDVAVARLLAIAPGATWAAIAAAGDSFADIPARLVDAVADPSAFETADAILFLSTARWTPALQAKLVAALERRPRPLVIANPDLVAPREGGLTLEPGLFGHDLLDAIAVETHWFGKPFPEAFAEAIARTGCPAHRLAMVGDTLHTDVLGGAAAGCRSVLVTDHGLFAGRDTGPFIAASGIIPDFIVPSI
jgi:HAD superfamily hydrolase (TIGR01450 family)